MEIADVIAWLKVFNEYGWPAVLFLGMLGFWFIPWVRRRIEKEEAEDKDHLTESINGDNEIMLVLGQIANLVNCQWAVFWQFHNGTVPVSGVPFMRMTVTHEYNERGFQARGDMYQGIPTSVFADALTDINHRGIIRVDRQSHYRSIVASYEREGVACGYYCKIEDVRGKFIGVLSVSFARDCTMDEKDTVYIKEAALRLAIVVGKIAASYNVPKRRKGEL